MKINLQVLLACIVGLIAQPTRAFEGRITVTITRSVEAQTLQYTVGTNCLRVERLETDRPYAKNLVARDTGEITLLFLHNRSFMRLPAQTRMQAPVGAPQLPSPNPAIAPANPSSATMPPIPPGVGPQTGAGISAMPMEPMELKVTVDKTNLLGLACEKLEIKQRGEVMEIWATDKLVPFQPYLQNQPHRFGPRMIEEQWGEMLKSKKLFPLLAILKFENGTERLRFEVKSIAPESIKKEDAEKLFLPPPDYQEIQPLPF
jgi:hypothetical protein